MGRLSHRKGETSPRRRVDQEARFGAKEQGACSKLDAYPVSVGHEVEMDGSSSQSHEAGSCEGIIEEVARASDTDSKAVPSRTALCGGAVPHHVRGGNVPRTSGERARWFAVGRFRLEEPACDDSTGSRDWQSGRSQNALLEQSDSA